MRKNKEIVTILDNKRKELNMSISDLATRVGMAKSTISRYFSFEREFPLNKLHLFSAALDLDTMYVLGFNHDEYDINEIYDELNKTDKKKVYEFAQGLLNKRGD